MNVKQRWLAFCCCLAYFASYTTRINYVAVRIAIADELSLSHPELVAELGLAISLASITYGLGQLVSGLLGDRFTPTLLVCAGLGGAVVCNLLMPILYPSVYLLAAVWGINGFFQSLIRPPLGRIISANYDEKGYLNACVAVSNASQVATILVYLVIPFCLQISDGEWRLAFYLPVAVGALAIAFWIFLVPKLCSQSDSVVAQCPSTEQKSEENAPKTRSLLSVIFDSGLIWFIPAVLVHGLLRDGITAWMPDFIVEIGGLGTGASILTTAILPVFCILCVTLAKKLCCVISQDGHSSALLFVISVVASAAIIPLLSVVNTVTFAIIVFLMALITGCMHGANHIFITRMPIAFKRSGRVSGAVGVLNAVTYVGGALSPYAVALVAGAGGWNNAVLLWVVLGTLSVILCLAGCRKWSTFKRNGMQ